MAFHDFFADRQADSGAGKLFPAVQALKHNENLFEVLGVDSQPVIEDGKNPLVVAIFSCGYVDAREFRAAVFDGVADNILK